MKKKPFLLLEVLIALSLIILCAVPLVRQPLKRYRAEIKALEQMEKERLADWTFSEVKESFLKNEVPWEKIPERGGTTKPIPLSPTTLSIPGQPRKTLGRFFTIHCHGEKPGRHNELFRSLWIDVFIDKTPYKFRLPVQKLP